MNLLLNKDERRKKKMNRFTSGKFQIEFFDGGAASAVVSVKIEMWKIERSSKSEKDEKIVSLRLVFARKVKNN